MLPFSFSTRIRPYNYHRTERLLSEMNRLSQNTFTIGQSSTVLYPATGTSEDWAKAIAQIPHTFSIELPPSTDAFDMRQDELNGFTFYADKDISTVAESTYRLLNLYLKNLAKLQQPSRITIYIEIILFFVSQLFMNKVDFISTYPCRIDPID